jgi:N-acetylglutamate synthase-like GNAT family acetyltransferase
MVYEINAEFKRDPVSGDYGGFYNVHTNEGKFVGIAWIEPFREGFQAKVGCFDVPKDAQRGLVEKMMQHIVNEFGNLGGLVVPVDFTDSQNEKFFEEFGFEKNGDVYVGNAQKFYETLNRESE